MLIQRAGVLIPGGCSDCQRRGLDHSQTVGDLWDTSGTLAATASGARCVVRDMGDEVDEGGGQFSGTRRRSTPIGDDRRHQRLLPAPGTVGNPIVL